ncbi:uncharacterized protein LOC115951810 [Quercus lobata]|uniref:uncharacterized protein LOC115951810 n=1 Tax=Quercus lobata TaxID=97700 RepID=UPI00124918A2|nr:uncharacterized protein LOC115951810 [Quercus lobata]
MSGDLIKMNQNLYCTHHRDKGHTTEQCRVFKDHLEQLVKSGHLKEFVMAPNDGATGQVSTAQRDTLPLPLGVIEVIHAALIGTSVSRCKGVLNVVSMENAECEARLEKKLKLAQGPIEFEDENLEGTTKPHDDTLVVTARINGFIMKRVFVD